MNTQHFCDGCGQCRPDMFPSQHQQPWLPPQINYTVPMHNHAYSKDKKDLEMIEGLMYQRCTWCGKLDLVPQ